MAGGPGFEVEAAVTTFESKITLAVVITCIVAASSGLIFGYDLGISGSCFVFLSVDVSILNLIL
jgi:hypothetical protein